MKITSGGISKKKNSFIPPQTWLTMKLIVFLMMVGLLNVSAEGNAQKITYAAKNVSLEKVFSVIKKQTGYVFFFRNDQLSKAKPVSVNFKDVPLEAALKEVLKGQPLVYSIKEKTVIISSNASVQAHSTSMSVSDEKPPVDISGRVLNESGDPVLVTVTVKGSNIATSSDENGNFKLFGVPEKATLVFTGINVETREIRIDGAAFLTVSVKTKTLMSEEVVVTTGYQTLKRSQLTGAYSTIDKSTYMQSVPTSGNIVENLEGRIPGLVLNVNQSRNNFADPNNTSPFTIRGVSTFSAIKKPLIVLNGFPTEIDIESINPYDIETITVLKDAASAAIYGVRASNGVIIINTKKGTAGKPEFHFTTALTYKPKPNYNKLDLLKGRGYVDFEAAKGVNDIENNYLTKEVIESLNGTYTPVFSITDDLQNGVITQEEANQKYNDIASYDNTDDYKKLFLQNQLLQSYDFNVSGGGVNSTYFLGVNHVNNQQSAKLSGFDKTSINYRGTFDFSKRISLDVQTIYSNINTKSVPIPDYNQLKPYQHFTSADGTALPTYFAPFNQDFFGFGDSYGTISSAKNQENIDLGLYDEMYYPVKEMHESSNKTKSDIYRVQANLKAKITSGLNLEIGGVFEKENDIATNYASENAYQTRIMLNYFAKMDPFTGRPVFQVPQGGVKKTLDNQINTYTLRAQLNYNKTLNLKHNISLLAGAETRRITNEGNLSTAFGYNDNTLTVKPVDLTLLGNYNYYPDYTGDIVSGIGGYVADQTFFSDYFNQTYTDDRFISYYANGAYTYDHRYTLTGSLRIDQSNLFGSDPKFRYTPLWSAGASWNIREEKFMRNSGKVDELKLRIAGGFNGNIIKNSGPFNFLRSEVNSYVANPIIGYAISAPLNNDLRWEKTFNFNTGVDFGFFDGRLSGSVDYYIKRGEDIFSSVQSDPTLGFSNLLTNNASIENRGWDIGLNTLNLHVGKFSWLSQVTGSFNQSKVINVRNQYNGFYQFTRAGGAENINGHPMNSVLVFDYAGLNDLGQPLVRDGKGSTVVLDFNSQSDIPFSALKFAGVNDPKYSIGFNNQFNMGSFSLSVLLMYYGGHVGLVQPPTVNDDRPTNGIQNYWKKPGDEKTTNIPGFSAPYGDPGYFSINYGYLYAAQFVRKFDYLALRDVTLTYNVKNAVTRKLGINNSKIILQVQNAAKYVFSGNDLDPETFDFSSGRRGLPVVPAFTFSLSTNF